MIALDNLPRGFLRAAVLFSVLATSVALMTIGISSGLSLAAGFAAGTGDSLIMLNGIKNSAQKGGVAALAGMKKNMLKRIALVGLAFFLAVKAQANIVLVFSAFLLMHWGCLVFFVITARRGVKPS